MIRSRWGAWLIVLALGLPACTESRSGSGNTNWLQEDASTIRDAGRGALSSKDGGPDVNAPALDAGTDAPVRVEAGADAGVDARAPVDSGLPDETAPTFGGIVTLEAARLYVDASPKAYPAAFPYYRLSDDTTARITWASATDDRTPRSGITYLVFAGKAPAAVDFSTPLAESAPGATTVDIGHLDSMATYSFAVRARDAAGNLEENAATLSLDTSVSYQRDVQPIWDRACVSAGCHTNIDPNIPPKQGLSLDDGISYASLVDVVLVEGQSIGRPDLLRVSSQVHDLGESGLWDKIQSKPAYGSPMPPFVSSEWPFHDADKDVIRRWILAVTPALTRCEIPATERPAGSCPTAAEPIVNGTFESGNEGWPGANIVDDGSGNHALRFEPSGAPWVEISPPAGPVGLRFRTRATTASGVGVWRQSKRHTTDFCTTIDVPASSGYVDHLLCGRDCAYGVADVVGIRLYGTEGLLVDDVQLVTDPACGLPDGGGP